MFLSSLAFDINLLIFVGMCIGVCAGPPCAWLPAGFGVFDATSVNDRRILAHGTRSAILVSVGRRMSSTYIDWRMVNLLCFCVFFA